MHTRELAGVEVTIRTDGDAVLVLVAGETLSPEEIAALRPSADWCRTVEIGPYTFDEPSLGELKAFVHRGQRETMVGDAAPMDPNLRAINLARRAAGLLGEVVAMQERIGATDNLDFARQFRDAATQLAGALQGKPGC